MQPATKPERRVITAAERALLRRRQASPLDVLTEQQCLSDEEARARIRDTIDRILEAGRSGAGSP